ncbi:MAG: hydroxyacylglutathione hydrolase [Wenzhouxiangellaceae bacterium]|nr:hydroxyacylglutathione hydrolase [Wenzhouxiangellaceae bacterium]
MDPEILAIPAFSDNYIWALSRSGHCLLVDPGEADRALAYLYETQLKLAGILLTHHHHDHVGGVDRIRADHDVPVWGPHDPRMPADTRVVGENERVDVDALGVAFAVIETPAHTRSHIAYFGEFDGRRRLFCGDTLFSVGCGRLFEGTPAQMQASLDKLAALPDDTLVYCAHEYTAGNCRFALQIEPENPQLQLRCQEVQRLREQDQITLPSTLAGEKSFNPFLRTRERAVIEAAREREPDIDASPESVLGAIRRWKDRSG